MDEEMSRLDEKISLVESVDIFVWMRRYLWFEVEISFGWMRRYLWLNEEISLVG